MFSLFKNKVQNTQSVQEVQPDASSTLLVLPELCQVVVHDINSVVGRFFYTLGLSCPEDPLPKLSEEDITEMRESVRELMQVYGKFNQTVQTHFKQANETYHALDQALMALFEKNTWKWTTIETQFEAPCELSIDWRKFTLFMTALLSYLNTLPGDDTSGSIKVSTTKNHSRNTTEVSLDIPGVSIDASSFYLLLRPFKETLSHKTSLELWILSALSFGQFRVSIAKADETGTVVTVSISD